MGKLIDVFRRFNRAETEIEAGLVHYVARLAVAGTVAFSGLERLEEHRLRDVINNEFPFSSGYSDEFKDCAFRMRVDPWTRGNMLEAAAEVTKPIAPAFSRSLSDIAAEQHRLGGPEAAKACVEQFPKMRVA